MSIFTKMKPSSESELHEILKTDLDAVEEGLRILKHKLALGSGKGVPDLLCVDSGGRLVIIEVKLGEDENVLFQALKYYNTIYRKKYQLAKIFSSYNINTNDDPRIIIIAESFSEDVRWLSTLVVPDVELFEYTVLQVDNEKQGLCCHSVSLPRIEITPQQPSSIEELTGYITKEGLRPIFKNLIQKIKEIDESIKDYSTSSYIGFRYKGRLIASLTPQRKKFVISANVLDEDGSVVSYDVITVETGSEEYNAIIDKIRMAYRTVKNIQ